MRIQALSSHTLKSAPNINFKQKQANVSYPENDINSIYARKAAALCGQYDVNLSGFASIKQTGKLNYTEGQKAFLNAVNAIDSVSYLISAGKQQLFENISALGLKVDFDYNEDTKNTTLNAYDGEELFLSAEFNSKGIENIVKKEEEGYSKIFLDKGKIEKIKHNETKDGKQVSCEKLYEYNNGQLKSVMIKHMEELYDNQYAEEKFVYMPYQNGRWDYFKNYENIHLNEFEESYKKADLLLSFDKNGLRAQAQNHTNGYINSNFTTNAEVFVDFTKNPQGERYENVALDRNDWTKLRQTI